MKRLIVVLSGLLVLPAFAEVAPIYYDAVEYSDMELEDAVEGAPVEEDDESSEVEVRQIVAPVVGGRSATTRTTTRAVPAMASRTIAPTRTTTPRGSAARNATTARTATTGASRAASSRATAARTATPNATTSSQAVAARRTTASSGNTTARAAVKTTTVAPAAKTSSIVQTDTVNKPLYTGRVGIRTSGITSRIPTIRMAGSDTSTTEATTKADAATEMDELAQLTDFCKSQYTQCMDNFCNVLDDNQGRCSCSPNVKNYAATEAALSKATEELQDVAQKIQFIGLSAEEIETLFSQTEAELKMSSTSDNTQLKNDLDRIKNLIVDVKSGNATSTEISSGISLDLSGLLDFTISSTGFDLASLFGNNNTANTNSISNQRGEQLYKTAAARCKSAVLQSCSAQGVDISLIANSYDLEIDKQCIVYERSLTDTNKQMVSTVRNAKSVLQKARLMVAQQKNVYDLRGCVNALDSCMQDEFVCGSDYENCLDPTGKWIVEGAVTTGGTPGVSGGNYGGYDNYDTDANTANDNQTKNEWAVANTLYSVWNYTVPSGKPIYQNAWNGHGSVIDYVTTIKDEEPIINPGETPDMMKYLRTKIGYTRDGRSYGMCASVLNKCQDYTYTGKGNDKRFQYDNAVIREYLTRTMTIIKSQQDKVIADYADSCVADVAACLSQNNYNYSGQSSLTTGTNYSDIAIDACMTTIRTCMSATSPDRSDLTVKTWLNKALNSGYPVTKELCKSYTGTTWTDNSDDDGGVCSISVEGLSFKFSLANNGWIATTGATKDKCNKIQNSTWDPNLEHCSTSGIPKALTDLNKS